MPDILDRKDIIILVDAFYERVRADQLLGPVFQHVDWPHHLPIMYNFWSSIVFGDQSYQGNPFQKHQSLAIDSTHFNRWLELFGKTVEDRFSGMNANEVKSRAASIAAVFQHKLGLLS
jgi:hemoglobin